MKMTTITTLLLFCVLTFGCQEENVSETPDERVMNTKLMTTYSNTQIQNAIISEHTLYPHHFVKNGAQLNELGERDLAVLSGNFAMNGGHLNVRKLDASDKLYQARVSVVRQKLEDNGIDTNRLSISDGMPGGSGMPSEKVLIIQQRVSEAVDTGTTGGTGTSTASLLRRSK
jgi:hypothetical protein